MIERTMVRIWTGFVPTHRAAEYRELMETVALPDYQAVQGNISASCLSRECGDGYTEFKSITHWRDLAAIKIFAGDDFEKAKYYDFDGEFLVDKATTVTHYECLTSA